MWYSLRSRRVEIADDAVVLHPWGKWQEVQTTVGEDASLAEFVAEIEQRKREIRADIERELSR